MTEEEKLTIKSLLDAYATPKAKSLMDSVDEHRQKIIDSFGNSLEAIGTENKIKQFDEYGMTNNTLNYPLWLALYNDSWVFKRAIDKPAQDQIRAGITLVGDNEKFNLIYKEIVSKRNDLIELDKWGALFGGSIAVVMLDTLTDEDYSKPLNVVKLRKSKVIRLYTSDRWFGVSQSNETVTDMTSLDFGKPEYYDITFADGKTLRVHHDYILRYEHRHAPKLIQTGPLQGWGYAEGAHILNELSRDDKLKASITSLLDKALIEVIKMSGMRGVFMGADNQNQEQLRKRLEMVNWGRNFNSLTFLDKDDEYQEHGFSGLGGLSDLLEKNFWLVSAALEMQGILFGDLKSGFSNDENALERYDEVINNRNEDYNRSVFTKFITILYKKYEIDEKVEFTFNSLLIKQHDKEKMESTKSLQELLSAMQQDGIITSSQYAKTMQLYVTKGITDFGLDDQAIEALKENEKNEMEDIDLDNLDLGEANGRKRSKML